ncbi:MULTISPECIES: extracellular solute-binding protein [unclassified Roseovarius]|uniref:extracellular solute-binding protein n=1 Tax=unclassified Roseovarius TaxID=2614913 RepID=UPI00273F71E7|nr:MULTISPECIES: extracellular solute-binding protein [unclassified Roseovarius]
MILKNLTRMAILALGTSTLASAAAAEGDLYIYSWGEYTPPDLVEKFEAEFGVDVHIDTYDSMETMISKLRAGAGGYDIIVPGDGTMQILIAENMVEQIDVHAMPNFEHVDERWREVYWDPEREFSAPWAWGSTAFVVDTEIVTGDIDTLAVLFDPSDEVKGKINMLRDINDVINMALRYLDLPRCNDNPADMKKVLALLETQKEWVKSFDSETKEPLVSGEAVVSMSWNGYAMRARDEKPSLRYVYPKEGFTGWMDNLAVPKGAQNIENAKDFINFVMAPENAAMITNYARYSNGIKGSEAFVDADLSGAPEMTPPADAPAPEFIPTCSPESTELYDRVWTKLMN